MSMDHSKLVYSTESGSECPQCGKPKKQCRCSTPTYTPRGDGIVRVSRETKGRKGKGVTVISGVPVILEDLQVLAKRLKQKCGAGGTVKDGIIEIQGDHRDTVVQELSKQGFTVKKSGG
jgi:translation initiation factor 1